MFQGYVNQVKKSEAKDLKREREKHGPDYTPQSKPFQKGDTKIFNLDDEDSSVRENVFQDVVKNLINQDARFGNFEKRILYLDCNNLYGMYLIFVHLNTNYIQYIFIRISPNSPLAVKRFPVG